MSKQSLVIDDVECFIDDVSLCETGLFCIFDEWKKVYKDSFPIEDLEENFYNWCDDRNIVPIE